MNCHLQPVNKSSQQETQRVIFQDFEGSGFVFICPPCRTETSIPVKTEQPGK